MSTDISTFIHETALTFISKLPVIYSAAYIFMKVTNQKCSKAKLILSLTAFFGVALVSSLLKFFSIGLALMVSYILFILTITLLTKKPVKISAPMSVIMLGISYCIRFICIFLCSIIGYFFALNPKDIFSDIIVLIINMTATFLIMKIKRLKNGLSFFDDTNNLGIGLLLSGFIVIVVMIVSGEKEIYISFYPILAIGMVISSIGAAVWIKNSITRHYKSRLQQKADEHYNSIIEEKDNIIDELTKSNNFLSKIVHRDNHLMTSLQYSLNELSDCNNSEGQKQIIEEILTLAKERNELVLHEQAENKILAKTGNSVIDGALMNMYIKATAHKISFDLIANADVSYIINHFISQTELETLLCDHIKDAIIAVDSCGRQNGSILASISNSDGIYEISVQDNGIEFEPDTLQKLGIERVTTHKDSGGNGIGFMTSFDTLRKADASLIITEYGADKPFTKSVTFRFDGQGKFIIKSYRSNILKETVKRSDVKIYGVHL